MGAGVSSFFPHPIKPSAKTAMLESAHLRKPRRVMLLLAILSPFFDGILLFLRPWSKEIHAYPSLVHAQHIMKTIKVCIPSVLLYRNILQGQDTCAHYSITVIKQFITAIEASETPIRVHQRSSFIRVNQRPLILRAKAAEPPEPALLQYRVYRDELAEGSTPFS
jgi:hypothetical protein